MVDKTDMTWDLVPISKWSVIEINMAVICACLTTLKPILTNYIKPWTSRCLSLHRRCQRKEPIRQAVQITAPCLGRSGRHPSTRSADSAKLRPLHLPLERQFGRRAMPTWRRGGRIRVAGGMSSILGPSRGWTETHNFRQRQAVAVWEEVTILRFQRMRRNSRLRRVDWSLHCRWWDFLTLMGGKDRGTFMHDLNTRGHSKSLLSFKSFKESENGVGLAF